MRIAAYCRVSTDDQADRGTIENQVEFAESYCKINNFNLIEVYKDDGFSGTLPMDERPAATQLLEDATRDKFDMVIVFKLDRLSRSTKITLNTIDYLDKHNIKLRSMTEPFETDTPAGRFMLTMLAGVADLERATIMERMQYGADRAAKKGQWLGGIVPYGYKVMPDKHLEVNEDKMPCGFSEADVVRLIYDRIANHGDSTVAVANLLNDMGIPTHYIKDDRLVMKGKRKVYTEGVWRPSRIGNLVRNTIYMGIHSYGKRTVKKRQLIEREMPAIVLAETYKKAIQNMRDNQIGSLRNTKDDSYLLRGIIKCAHCGRAYCGTKYRSKKINGVPSLCRYYVCLGKSGVYVWGAEERCKSKAVNADFAESIVWDKCVELIKNPNDLAFAKELKSENHKAEIDLLEARLISFEKEKEKIMRLYRKNYIATKDVENQFTEIDSEKVRVFEEIGELQKQQSQKSERDEKRKALTRRLNEYRHTINNPSHKDKKAVIALLVKRVTVYHTYQGEELTNTDFKISFYFD